MNNNTLYITFDGLSDPLGQSQVIPYLIGLARNGFKITILSCEKEDRLKSQKENIENYFKHLSIDWKYILYDENGGFLSRYNYVRKIAKLAQRENRIKEFRIVHCRSYLSALVGLKMKQKSNTRFVFDMRGFWADERIDGGVWIKKNLLHLFFYRYFKIKEKQFLRQADAIVSLTNKASDYLSIEFPEIHLKSKTTIIPCCVNVQAFNPRERKAIDTIAISEANHVLVYTGSIGTWYYTKEMIDCVLVWKSLIPNIKLLIVTRDKETLTRIIEQCTAEQKELIITTSANYNQIPSILALAKAAIFFIKPAFSKIASSPTKMAECWAMNLPIITNAGIGDNDIYFKENKGGVLLSSFNTNEYKRAGEAYLQIQNTKQDYRNIALKDFALEIAVKRYTEIYNSLIPIKL